jgi:uncharacterized protein (TIGR02118 family)
MVKLVFCLRRARHLTWDEFSDYWRDVHAPLVASHAEVLGIRRYVQVRTLDQPRLQEDLRARNGSPEPFDGVAEVWLDSIDNLRPSSPEAKAASAELREDERRFIDLPSSPILAGDELVVVSRQP